MSGSTKSFLLLRKYDKTVLPFPSFVLCSRFSAFTCICPRLGFFVHGGALSRRHTSDVQVEPSDVNLLHSDGRKRQLKEAWKDLFTLQRLVFCFAQE